MNGLIKQGKNRTILIAISILLLSVHTIYLYHAVKPEIESKKLIQQIFRFLLTVGLLVMVYKGKKWAKIVAIILFSLATLGALTSLLVVNTAFINKVPLLVMTFVYSMAIYHFGFSKSFKEFFNYQNITIKPKEPVQNAQKLMEIEKFWEIIEVTKSKSSSNYEQQQAELEKELLKLTANEILEFDNRFRTLRGEIYHWDFWAAAYIINGGCSDDCFSDFRGWLIGQGKAVYEAAKNDIESLSNLTETNNGDWEGLSYIPINAYEKKTGNDIPNGIQENFKIYGEEWNEELLEDKFPKLWMKFGNC